VIPHIDVKATGSAKRDKSATTRSGIDHECPA